MLVCHPLMVIVPYGSMTHLRASAAVVCRASMVFSPSTDSATATRTGYGLRRRISYSRPFRASMYTVPRAAIRGQPAALHEDVHGRPVTGPGDGDASGAAGPPMASRNAASSSGDR